MSSPVRIGSASIGLIGLMFSLAVGALAEQPSGQRVPGRFRGVPTVHESKYANLAKGRTLTVGSQRYVVVAEARAAIDPDDGDREVLERKGPFVIYREGNGEFRASGPVTLSEASDSGQALVTHAVVLNERTGRLGVVLGTLIVKLADMSVVASLAAAAGIQLTDQFPQQALVFFTVPPGMDVAAAVAILRGDPRVISAEPEILEQARTSR